MRTVTKFFDSKTNKAMIAIDVIENGKHTGIILEEDSVCPVCTGGRFLNRDIGHKDRLGHFECACRGRGDENRKR